ncbi:hypothetical protein [Geodermatophilus sp. DSM 45219]|uniref:hypothetical protein n=1 Tax=Geodermatophilus sp. DSM 45219 TaxID=1881103 RepID=UPI0008830A9D|nr:hypothetical protein [Geodermatophilus sp. DSM 45219]SDO37163.1 hypothetical protein SAMN05428965_3778 [Geodermatophilus sp. DSM 45219]
MDLRFVAFDLIARDATLRPMLARYARLLQAEGPPEDRPEPCFVSLGWTRDERASAPVGSQLLTVQVHVSPYDSSSPARLDAVLQRLRAALTVTGPNPCITTRCLTTSVTSADSRFGTLVTTSTWAIAPVPTEPRRAAPIELVPWSVGGGPDGAGLLVPGVGALSLN